MWSLSLEMKIFLKVDYTEEQRAGLERDLKANPLISEVRFETKDEALENFFKLTGRLHRSSQ